jgi:hypothetical protein
MKFYIEAYYCDGAPILGNCDGQGVMNARQYKRNSRYKALLSKPSPRVAVYKIVTPAGVILEELKGGVKCL